MQLVGRPKLARPLPEALPRAAVEALMDTLAHDRESMRQTDWVERDLALALIALLAGLRADKFPPGRHQRYPHHRGRRRSYPRQRQRRQGARYTYRD
jgi:hypothetical protein